MKDQTSAPNLLVASFSSSLPHLARELDLALQAHHSSFEHLHADVRQARIDCEKARDALVSRGPVRGGSHYLQRSSPQRERLTTLPLGLSLVAG